MCCAGRAGRDGQPARCMLMYRFGDALRQAAIINFEPTWQANLYAVMQYTAALSTCRRALICRSECSFNPFCVLLNCEDKVKVTNRHGLQCPDVGTAALFGTVFLHALCLCHHRETACLLSGFGKCRKSVGVVPHKIIRGLLH